MDFRSGKELLELCREEGLPISEIMKRRETDSGLRTEEELKNFPLYCPKCKQQTLVGASQSLCKPPN